MKRLGGSIFVHNAVKFDYCVAESIASLCAACDEVAVLDAQSDDGTIDILRECEKKYDNLTVHEGGNWNCADNYVRLALLADEAKSRLSSKCKWHFMLQADEVLHEDSFPHIRDAMKQNYYTSTFCRRVNLFGDLNHHLRFDLPQDRKPCSDIVIRLAHREYSAAGDAESLGVDPKTITRHYQENIHIFHYGFVRRDQNHIDKVISMQSWFFGLGGQPDHRVVAMKDKADGVYDWTTMKENSDLGPLPKPHPVFAKAWAEERQKEKTILPQ